MKKVIVALMFLGIIGLGINAIFGWRTFTFIQNYQTDEGILLYKLDIWGYIQNIKNSFGTISSLTIDTPTRVWNDDVVNDLALMLDWILFGLNVLIYSFRVGGYTILQTLAIIGVNTIQPNSAGGLQWLVNLCRFLRDLTIAYV